MSNRTVEIPEALALAACFPLRRLAKTPAVKWQQYEGPLPTGTVGYGVDCGRSGFVVIDLDCHDEAANGLEAWRDLLKIHGGEMGDTFTVSTANGGLHLYYLSPEGVTIKNSASKLAPGVDVRAQGGYVVGPNSVINSTDGLEATYEVIQDEVIAELPAWLLDLLTIPKAKPALWDSSQSSIVNDDFPDNYARKALESAYYTVSTAPSGKRNDVLNSEAYGAAKAGAPVDRVIADLSRAALGNGLAPSEVESTVARAANEGAQAYIPRTRVDLSTGQVEVTDGATLEFKKFTKEYYLDFPLGARWADAKKGKLLYVMESSQWLRYEEDYGIWVEVRDSSVKEDAANWLRREYNSAALRNIEAVSRHAERCLSKQTADHTISMGKLHLLVSSSKLDKSKDLLVVANGVVDLRTSQLSPFDRDLLSTKRVAYPYDPAAISKYWDKVLEALPDDALFWVQLMTGQTLTGHQPDKAACFFLFGAGSNGKSTFFNLMEASAGSYGAEPPQSSLMRASGRGEDFGLVEFKGVRQALVEELPDERNLDAKAIKKLAGTKNITARGMYQSFQTFEVMHTLWVSCNRLPNVSETDWGTWRRLIVIPFLYTYLLVLGEDAEPHHRLADIELVKASDDAATIIACLAWRIAGAKRWYEDSTLEAQVPDSVQKASDLWRKRSDHLLAWTEECLVADQTAFTLSVDLRDSFNQFLRNNGYPAWGAKLFLERFETGDFFTSGRLVYNAKATVPRGIHQSKYTPPDGEPRIAGKQPAHFLGVRFRTTADDDREVSDRAQAAIASVAIPDDASELTNELDFMDDNELFDDETVF